METIEEGGIRGVPERKCQSRTFLRLALRLPVSATDVASIIGRDTTAVNDNTEKDEANASQNFHQTENKFDLSK